MRRSLPRSHGRLPMSNPRRRCMAPASLPAPGAPRRMIMVSEDGPCSHPALHALSCARFCIGEKAS